MRRLALAAGVACAVFLADSVGAQNPSNTSSGTTMPGQIVGSYRGTVNPVGNRLPAAGQQVGFPVTNSPLMRPYDPNHPYDAFKGSSIDPKQVLAPLIGPDGRPVEPPDALDKLSDKLKALLGLMKPNPPRPAYAPGVTRRARERHKMLWRRD